MSSIGCWRRFPVALCPVGLQGSMTFSRCVCLVSPLNLTMSLCGHVLLHITFMCVANLQASTIYIHGHVCVLLAYRLQLCLSMVMYVCCWPTGFSNVYLWPCMCVVGLQASAISTYGHVCVLLVYIFQQYLPMAMYVCCWPTRFNNIYLWPCMCVVVVMLPQAPEDDPQKR